MSSSRRRRRQKPDRQTSIAPEERERRQKAAEGWRKRAEEERAEGVDGREAGGRWLDAHDAGRAYRPATGWRAKAISPAQTRTLRGLGLNPLTCRNAGEASDAITRARAGAKQ